MPKNPWTKREVSILLQGIGVFGWDWLCRKTHRSKNAVRCKVNRVFQSGITRGVATLGALIRDSGYSRSQLLRARDALGQKWKRTSRHGRYLIQDEQVEELIGWLRVDYWAGSVHAYRCLWCERSHRLHRGRGLCYKCYRRYCKRVARAGWPIRAVDMLARVRELIERDPKNVALRAAESDLKRGWAVREQALTIILEVPCPQ